MTVRPCPTCEGQGDLPVDRYASGPDGWVPCPSCAAMPWLPCPYPTVRTGTDGERGCTGRHHNPAFNCHGSGRFKPDPETVMWLCWQYGELTERQSCDTTDGAHAERCGWVARPERLETAE